MSGGFYKYRCKYFLTHNCQNWVYVNKAACATCMAAGRFSKEPCDPTEDTACHVQRTSPPEDAEALNASDIDNGVPGLAGKKECVAGSDLGIHQHSMNKF